MRPIPIILCALMFLFVGCHQVTEYQGGASSSLVFIRTSDFQVEKTMEGFPGCRTIISHGSNGLILLSSEGTLHMIDLETLSVDTSYSIGGSSGTGYGDAVYAGNGNLYVLGPGSQVMEVDLGTSTVKDNFTPGSNPGALAPSPVLPRIYFVDTVDDYIGEIYTGSNATGFESRTYCSLADVMVEPTGGEYVVAAGANSSGSLYCIWLNSPSTGARRMTVSAGSPCSEIIPMTSDSIFAVSCPQWNADSGYLRLFRGYVQPDSTVGPVTVGVEGHPVAMCFNGSSGYVGQLSALGRTDSGNTAVTVFGFTLSHMAPELEAVIELDGFPRDIISPGNGDYIIVLISE